MVQSQGPDQCLKFSCYHHHRIVFGKPTDNQQVQIAVLVIVAPGDSGSAMLAVGVFYPGFYGYVGKCSITVVSEQLAGSEVAYKEVNMTVVVIISPAGGIASSGRVFNSGGIGHIIECPVPVVPV